MLHVCESTEGGVGVFIDGLARFQLALGDEVGLAVPSAGPVPAGLEAAGAEHHAWEAVAQPGTAVVGEMRSLRAILAAVRPDVLHLHSSKAGLVGRLLVRGRRATIHQPHAWSFFARTGVVRRATLAWERLAARWADVVLCVSDDERRRGLAAGVRAEYRVLPNGVDLERFPLPQAADRTAARERLGLGDEPLVVCVGRLHRQKNQGALLDAWPAVREALPRASLVFVGEGPDRAELERRAVEGVTFAGQLDDVRPWLAAATLVAQPSRWEGMSLSLLEAMASARSVVVTDVSGMREVAEGVGAVVAPGDPEALATAMVERLRHPERADEEGRRGRERVELSHDRRVQFEGIAALYDDVIGRRAART